MEEKNQPRRPRRSPEEPLQKNESLVYGKNPVTELLKSGSGVDTVLIAEGMAPAVAAYYTALAKEAGATVKRVHPNKLRLMTGTESHQGVAAFASEIEYVTVEDLMGTVEIVVFPRDYEKWQTFINEDARVFIQGRVNAEDDKPSKMICEKIIPFERTKKELWIQFPDKATFLDEEQIVYGYLADSDGDDEVMIYCAKERAVKKLPKNRNIGINEQILSRLMNHFGEKRVKVVEKPIENIF